MVNIRQEAAVREECIEKMSLVLAQMREMILEVEKLARLMATDDYLLTRGEVAEYLRCDETHIPKSIPRMRVSKNYLFRKKDVDAFLNSKRRQ